MSVPNINIGIVETPEDVTKFWDWLTRSGKGRESVACDTETSGLQWWRPGFQIRLIQFGDDDGGWAIPFHHWPRLISAAFEWLSEHRADLIFHNLPFDSLALNAEGITLDPTILVDTMILAALGGFADGTRKLKPLAVSELGPWAGAGANTLERGMKNAGWDWATVPIGWKPYPFYGVLDTVLTHRLYSKWKGRLKEWSWHHDMEIAAALHVNQMSRLGVGVDGSHAVEQIERLQSEENKILEYLSSEGISNPDQNGPLIAYFKKQDIPLDKTTMTGQLSVDKEVLESINDPVARAVLQYRRVHRMWSTYIDKTLQLAGGEMGRSLVHPGMWAMEARTGRMSVADPPLQQFSADAPEVRNIIVPRNEDEVLVGCDYGQIELRVWASVMGDQALRDTLNATDRVRGDFFTEVGKTVYHDPNFTKGDKRRALLKTLMYSTLYGAGIEKQAASAGVSVKEIAPVASQLGKAYPSIADKGMSAVKAGTDGPFVKTPTGRQFKVKDRRERRKLPNYLVQGHSAEILKIALARLHAVGLGEQVMLAVHDELILSVNRKDAEYARKELEDVMNSVVDPDEYGVAVRGEATVAEKWGALK